MAKSLISIDTKSFNKLEIELKDFPKQANAAAFDALKRTVESIVTTSIKEITAIYGIKSNDVRKHLKPVLPSKGHLEAGVVALGHTLSMAHFSFTPKQPTKRRKRVTVPIFKGVKKSLGNKAFVATTGAASADKVQFNVFMRTGRMVTATKGRYRGKLREEIKVPRTLSVPQMLGNEKIANRIQDAAEVKFIQRLDHEIGRRLEKINNKIGG